MTYHASHEGRLSGGTEVVKTEIGGDGENVVIAQAIGANAEAVFLSPDAARWLAARLSEALDHDRKDTDG